MTNLEIVGAIIIMPSVLIAAVCTAVEYRFPLAQTWNDLRLEWALWRDDMKQFTARERRRRKRAQAVKRWQLQADEYEARGDEWLDRETEAA